MNTHRLTELARNRVIVPAGAACLLMTAVSTEASMTAMELDRLRKDGRDIKLIDLRMPHRFQQGSIPGAMNIPATVLLEKTLPPLGEVVIFDEGLGEVDVEALAEGLNKRKGFSADVLDGGYAAWREFSGESTETVGLREPEVQMVTYQKLVRMKDAVLMVDLRRKKEARNVPRERGPAQGDGKAGPAAAAAEAVDALAEFCRENHREYCGDLAALRKDYRRRVPIDPRAGTAARTGPAVTPLVVLVDDDHKTAYVEYRKLKAEGYRRVVILAGGELALQTEGRPGLGRIGGAVLTPEDANKE